MSTAKIILLFLFIQSAIFAQVPLLQWQKSYGGSSDDIAYAIKQTADGGFITVGSTASQDGDVTGNHYNSQYPEDFWVVKTDACGTLQWQKDFGGTARDIAYSVQQTIDKGFIVAGFTNSTDGDITSYHGGASDFWIIKLDTLGNIQWQETLGGPGEDGAQAIQQTADSGYVVVGWSSSNGNLAGDHDFDYWIVKLDTGGAVKWQKLYGGLYDDTPFDIKQTIDGGYIAAGYSSSNDGDVTGHHGTTSTVDYWVIKTDSVGNLMWQKSYGGTKTDQANAVQQTIDGGYILAGFTSSSNGDITVNHGAFDYWIIKTDAAGSMQWQKTFGGTSNDQAYAIQELTERAYIIAGISYSNNGDVSANHGGVGDFWVVKIDTTANIKWQKTLGGSGADAASAIETTADAGFIVAGATNSNDGDITNFKGAYDFWIVKLNTVLGNINICNGDSTTLTATGADHFIWNPGAINSSTITIKPTSNITYTLTSSTGTCSANYNTINITVNNLPNVTFTSLGFADSVCLNSGAQILNGGLPSGGVYYGPGASYTTFDPTLVGIGTYTLTYTYTDINNCVDSASHPVTVKTCNSTDLSLNSITTNILYPNPAVDNIFITCALPISKIAIYNMLGNKIKEIFIINNLTSKTVDISEFNKGIYFAEINYSNNTSTLQKFIKQ